MFLLNFQQEIRSAQDHLQARKAAGERRHWLGLGGTSRAQLSRCRPLGVALGLADLIRHGQVTADPKQLRRRLLGQRLHPAHQRQRRHRGRRIHLPARQQSTRTGRVLVLVVCEQSDPIRSGFKVPVGQVCQRAGQGQ